MPEIIGIGDEQGAFAAVNFNEAGFFPGELHIEGGKNGADGPGFILHGAGDIGIHIHIHNFACLGLAGDGAGISLR